MIPDGGIREAIKRETGRSVVVEASAGTGKTTLLTDRVCTIVGSGTPLENIAVVTFTEAAAGELRTRIREIIPAEARRKMDQAWIHTIHGFASRILREFYHLCGGVPEFSTEASHFSKSEMEVLWDLFLVSVEREDLETASDALRRPGSPVLLEASGKMEKHRWLTDHRLLGDTGQAAEDLTEVCLKRLHRLESSCTDRTDKLCLQVTRAIDRLSRGDLDSGIARNCGSQSSWGGRAGKEEAKAEIGIYLEDLKTLQGYKLMNPVTPALENLVFPFLNRIRRLWDDDPTRLSYDDLLFNAGEAVVRSAELRRRLDEKFRYILIDEFQDTSLVQVRLFRSILENSGMKEKLTVVGDPKQSIYGWRSADIETYKETVRDLEDNHALSETIRVNFRSAKSIVRFVNSFAETLFKNSSPEEKPFSSEYSSIEPAPGAADGEGVYIHLLPDVKGSSAETYSAMQASGIADLISDPGSTAVLFRTKTHMDELLREFDSRGIPYRVEAGRDFHDRPEARDTASLLRYLLHPDDTRAEVETLRSMYFGIDDIEITRWKQTGVPSLALEESFSIIHSLRETVRMLPPHLFIRTLFRNTCILESIRRSGYQSGRRLGNMRFIMEQAETITDCLKLLETLEGTSPISADEPSAPPEESDGAVTVTTIHRAKGLAWKHVILANPGKNFRGITDTVLTDQRSGRLGLKLKNAISASYPALKKREENRRTAEYRRLLYVAVTRPRERLDIFLQPTNSENTPCGIIHSALDRSDHFRLIEMEPMEVVTEKNSLPEAPPTSPGEPFADLFDLRFPDGDTEREEAMRLGTEVHRIMEFIRMDDHEGWLLENRELLLKTLEFPERTVKLVRNFFRTFDLTGAEIAGREYPIVTRERFYYVDLLLRRNGILEAVDYKTDTGDPMERMMVYREHQRLYRRELERASGKKVKAFLVFLHHGLVMEID